MFCLLGTGSYRGCGWCMQKGQYCKQLYKVDYPGNRRFQPSDCQQRKDCNNFPEQLEEKIERPTSKLPTRFSIRHMIIPKIMLAALE